MVMKRNQSGVLSCTKKTSEGAFVSQADETESTTRRNNDGMKLVFDRIVREDKSRDAPQALTSAGVPNVCGDPQFISSVL